MLAYLIIVFLTEICILGMVWAGFSGRLPGNRKLPLWLKWVLLILLGIPLPLLGFTSLYVVFAEYVVKSSAVIAFFSVVLFVFAAIIVTKVRNYGRKSLVMAWLAVFLIPILPYTPVFWNDLRLKEDIKPAILASRKEFAGEDGKIDYYRVLSASSKTAKVDVKYSGPDNGHPGEEVVSEWVLTLHRKNGKWRWQFKEDYSNSKIIYTSQGSANYSIFPPYSF